ncbi:MAG: hypothetical protein WCS31_18455 [Verrucomicrobiae bacterium]
MGAVRMLVVNLPMHVLSKQLVFTLISQHPQTGRVAEGALSMLVEPVDGFCCGIQKELELSLALIQLGNPLFLLFVLERELPVGNDQLGGRIVGIVASTMLVNCLTGVRAFINFRGPPAGWRICNDRSNLFFHCLSATSRNGIEN